MVAYEVAVGVPIAVPIFCIHRVFLNLNTFLDMTNLSNLMMSSQNIYSLAKGTLVKLIIATIKPFKLEEVREAVSGIGVSGMMVTEVKGFGAQSGHTETYRGAEYTVNFVPKIKLEIAVKDEMADQVVEAISNAARTGKIGDGKVFVLDLEKALRVRTGETNEEAL